ncbi:MAG: methyltransferase, partial [Kiritimatiellia bacterium]
SSADRIEPDCRTTGPTGDSVRIPGCVYDHCNYDAEIAIKQAQLLEFIRYMPNANEAEILPPAKSPKQLHYRNKLILHTHSKRGSVKLGYLEEKSHRVLDIPECPLSCVEINEKLHAIRSSGQFKKLPDKATVTLRYTKDDGILWWINRPSQRSWITEESAIGKLRVSSDGFFQVNPAVSQALTKTVMDWFHEEPTEHILDLYCGAGLFGLACRQAGGIHLTGVESGKRAILAARHNATKIGIKADFLVRELGKAELNLQQLTKDPLQTTCIVDPPRSGMDKSVIRTLAASRIPRLFYISCNPSTLQRDLKMLITEGDYRIKRIQLFDMFPRTAHFEAICELTGK